MNYSYWHKQSVETPLYPDLLWSRPENRASAGKLLIIGGNAHGFNAVSTAYSAAIAAGVGSCRTLLPDVLQKSVGKVMPDVQFAPSTPSGSFARQAAGDILVAASWADAVLLAGDVGHNSETVVCMEAFLRAYDGIAVLAGDTINNFLLSPESILDRQLTLIVPTFSQLQKLTRAARHTTPFVSDMDMMRLVENLHDFSFAHSSSIIMNHNRDIYVAFGGEISTTSAVRPDFSESDLAAHAAVWWLQNPEKPFAALTSSMYDIK